MISVQTVQVATAAVELSLCSPGSRVIQVVIVYICISPVTSISYVTSAVSHVNLLMIQGMFSRVFYKSISQATVKCSVPGAAAVIEISQRLATVCFQLAKDKFGSKVIQSLT